MTEDEMAGWHHQLDGCEFELGPVPSENVHAGRGRQHCHCGGDTHCQHVPYYRILSAMCKALGSTWTCIRVCLQTRNEGRPLTGGARARGSGVGETSNHS